MFYTYIIILMENLNLFNLNFPESLDLDRIILFFCKSLGLEKRDEIKIFSVLFVMSKYEKGVDADELSEKTGINYRRVKSTLNKMINLGLIRKSRDKYLFRENTLSMTINY